MPSHTLCANDLTYELPTLSPYPRAANSLIREIAFYKIYQLLYIILSIKYIYFLFDMNSCLQNISRCLLICNI